VSDPIINLINTSLTSMRCCSNSLPLLLLHIYLNQSGLSRGNPRNDELLY